MLTKRFEGSSVKCDTYWPTNLHQERRFGHYIVKAVSNCKTASEDDAQVPIRDGFNFGLAQTSSDKRVDDIARRTFILTNTLTPSIPGREIVHFQYMDWPDLGVPSSPDGFLNLIWLVNQANISDDVPGSPSLFSRSGQNRWLHLSRLCSRWNSTGNDGGTNMCVRSSRRGGDGGG